jgi:uncharacterized protein YbaA (DUF1428 family)
MAKNQKPRASYVDGYVLPVPKKKMSIYRRMAQGGARVWKKHGALDYKECVADDLKTMWGIPLSKPFKLKPGETLVFAYVVFKSRKHRDSVNAKVMKEMMADPNMKDMQMPFDMKRMGYGGFKIIAGA